MWAYGFTNFIFYQTYFGVRTMDKQPENQAYEVPLYERLETVPHNARLIIEDKSGLGTSFIPIGSLANKTAAELRRLHQVNQELRESVKKANAQAEHFERLWYLQGDVNQELIEALSLMCDTFLDTEGSHGQLERNSIEKAHTILAKHREQA